MGYSHLLLSVVLLVGVHCDGGKDLFSDCNNDSCDDQSTSLEEKPNYSDYRPISYGNGDGEPCMKHGKSGTCVKHYTCKTDGRDVGQDGDITMTERSSNCPYGYTCCPEEEIDPNKIPDIPSLPEGCGYSNPGAQQAFPFRMLSSQGHAQFGEFPWMVAILKRVNNTVNFNTDFVGGGTLIHPKVVMTSTHKLITRPYIYQPHELMCRAGEYDIGDVKETYPHQDRNVREIVAHENFDNSKRTILNSMSLIFLEKPYSMMKVPHIGIACIGQMVPAPDTECYSMGWGRKKYGPGVRYIKTLKKVEIPIVRNEQCVQAIRSAASGDFGLRLYTTFSMDPSLMCAGGNGQDTCTGDGGASLVCNRGTPEKPVYVVYGMVAWGINCNLSGVPAVYVNVPHFYTWIENTFREKGLDSHFTYPYEFGH